MCKNFGKTEGKYKKQLEKMGNGPSAAFNDVGNFFTDTVGGGIVDAANQTGNFIVDTANGVGDKFVNDANQINDIFTNTIPSFIVDSATVVNETVIKDVVNAGNDVGNFFGSSVPNFFTGDFTNFFTDTLGQPLGNAWDKVTGVAADAWDIFSKLIDLFVGFVRSIADGSILIYLIIGVLGYVTVKKIL